MPALAISLGRVGAIADQSAGSRFFRVDRSSGMHGAPPERRVERAGWKNESPQTKRASGARAKLTKAGRSRRGAGREQVHLLPDGCAAAFNSAIVGSQSALAGFWSTATRWLPALALGSAPAALVPSRSPAKLTPVTLPSGRPRLATSPSHRIGARREDNGDRRCRRPGGAYREAAPARKSTAT